MQDESDQDGRGVAACGNPFLWHSFPVAMGRKLSGNAVIFCTEKRRHTYLAGPGKHTNMCTNESQSTWLSPAN